VLGRTRAQDEASPESRLAGSWRLVAVEAPDASGAINASRAEGLLVFTADGHMSVQVRNLETHADSPYSRNGYEATYGTIALNAERSSFVYHVEGSLAKDLVGQDLPRSYQFVDDHLVLASTRPDEKWRVVWRRG
jgi:hypothetical protein